VPPDAANIVNIADQQCSELNCLFCTSDPFG